MFTAPTFDDMTSKARLASAALTLFSRRGVAATSSRLIATKARVSPALVNHHFGSKHGLRAYVEAKLIGDLRTSSYLVDTGQFSLASYLGGLTRVPFEFPLVSNFIRRSFCDASADGICAFHVALRAMLEEGLGRLEQAGHIEHTTDAHWRATQVMMVVFGASVLEAAAVEVPSINATTLPDRVTANIRLLSHGLGR